MPVFQMLPIAYVGLTQKVVSNSAFPRWHAYFTFWSAVIFEAGALPYLFKAGPFAWNGLISFWLPFPIFGLWMMVTAFVLLRALSLQQAEAMSRRP
jgi:hypothetical protein